MRGDAPGVVFAPCRQADQRIALVFDRSHRMVLAASEIPPFVAADPVSVGIRAGADGRMPGSRLRVRITEVAIGEVRAVIEEEFESAAFEVGAVALKVIGAELVEHQDDDQLRMRVVRSSVCARGRGKKQEPRSSGRQEVAWGSTWPFQYRKILRHKSPRTTQSLLRSLIARYDRR